MKRLTPTTDFPALITQRRADLGLTQAAAAKAAGIDATVWSRVERGRSVQLTLECALKMLKGVRLFVNLTPDELPETVADEPSDALFTV